MRCDPIIVTLLSVGTKSQLFPKNLRCVAPLMPGFDIAIDRFIIRSQLSGLYAFSIVLTGPPYFQYQKEKYIAVIPTNAANP